MGALPRFAVAHVYVVIFFTGDDTGGMRRAVGETLCPLFGGAYLAKPDSAKSESAVQERAKPYLAKPGN